MKGAITVMSAAVSVGLCIRIHIAKIIVLVVFIFLVVVIFILVLLVFFFLGNSIPSTMRFRRGSPSTRGCRLSPPTIIAFPVLTTSLTSPSVAFTIARRIIPSIFLRLLAPPAVIMAISPPTAVITISPSTCSVILSSAAIVIPPTTVFGPLSPSASVLVLTLPGPPPLLLARRLRPRIVVFIVSPSPLAAPSSIAEPFLVRVSPPVFRPSMLRVSPPTFRTSPSFSPLTAPPALRYLDLLRALILCLGSSLWILMSFGPFMPSLLRLSRPCTATPDICGCGLLPMLQPGGGMSVLRSRRLAWMGKQRAQLRLLHLGLLRLLYLCLVLEKDGSLCSCCHRRVPWHAHRLGYRLRIGRRGGYTRRDCGSNLWSADMLLLLAPLHPCGVSVLRGG
jgi:hypothetical protein